MATDSDYQYEINGLKIGHGTQYQVEKVEGLFSLPDLIISDTQREGSDGEYSSNDETLQGRTIDMDINMLGERDECDDLYEVLQDATSDIQNPFDFLIKRPGRSERRLRCKIRRRAFTSDYDFATGMAKGAIQLKAMDPRIYESVVHQAGPTPLYNISGGRSYPRTYPRAYTSAIITGTLPMPNDGTYPAPAFIRINGPVTNPTIEHLELGRTLVLTTVLAAGEFIDIDLDNKTVLLNGTTNRRSTLTTAGWFLLVPGQNTLRYTGTAGAGTPTLSASWSSAWA